MHDVANRSYQIAVQLNDLLQEPFWIETTLRWLLDFQKPRIRTAEFVQIEIEYGCQSIDKLLAKDT